jgi:hypothetical protein
VTERDDYSKQLLAAFIVARLKAKQAAAGCPEPPVEQSAPAPPSGAVPTESHEHLNASRRHHETPLPCRARYPLFGLGSSN